MAALRRATTCPPASITTNIGSADTSNRLASSVPPSVRRSTLRSTLSGTASRSILAATSGLVKTVRSIARHGPHQSAQKSINTGIPRCLPSATAAS